MLEDVLEHLTSRQIEFKDTKIQVADVYGEKSQELKINFDVQVEQYTNPTPLSLEAQTYRASINFDSDTSEKPEENPVIVAGNTLTGNLFTTSTNEVKKIQRLRARTAYSP